MLDNVSVEIEATDNVSHAIEESKSPEDEGKTASEDHSTREEVLSLPINQLPYRRLARALDISDDFEKILEYMGYTRKETLSFQQGKGAPHVIFLEMLERWKEA